VGTRGFDAGIVHRSDGKSLSNRTAPLAPVFFAGVRAGALTSGGFWTYAENDDPQPQVVVGSDLITNCAPSMSLVAISAPTSTGSSSVDQQRDAVAPIAVSSRSRLNRM